MPHTEEQLLSSTLTFANDLSDTLGDRAAAVEILLTAAREVLLGLNGSPNGSRPLSLAITHVEDSLWRVKEHLGKMTF